MEGTDDNGGWIEVVKRKGGTGGTNGGGMARSGRTYARCDEHNIVLAKQGCSNQENSDGPPLQHMVGRKGTDMVAEGNEGYCGSRRVDVEKPQRRI
ncbi:hypothetical protein Syun_016773 [Stephania yunnanensis]|uniref:Uncharacterized protein n=1 Tax=Stephania yunnanensis TaxID=152371 RepID=A0AAP0P578_9MAGN